MARVPAIMLDNLNNSMKVLDQLGLKGNVSSRGRIGTAKQYTHCVLADLQTGNVLMLVVLMENLMEAYPAGAVRDPDYCSSTKTC